MHIEGKTLIPSSGLWGTRCSQVVTLFLSLLSCMTLDKLFNFSEPQFLLVYSGDTTVYMELNGAMHSVLIRQSA